MIVVPMRHVIISCLLDSQTLKDGAEWFGVSSSVMQKWCVKRGIKDAVGLTIRERFRRVARQLAVVERAKSRAVGQSVQAMRESKEASSEFDLAWRAAFSHKDMRYEDHPAAGVSTATGTISRNIMHDRPAAGLRSVTV